MLQTIEAYDLILSPSAFDETQIDSAKESASPHDDLDVDRLVAVIASSFRRHGHINNVVTHISGGQWRSVEDALRSILDPRAGASALSPLAENLIDLMCADRGVTGRIVRPYVREVLERLLGAPVAARLIRHVTVLFIELECKTHQPRPLTSERTAGEKEGVPC